MAEIVRIRDLVVKYGPAIAVNGLSLTVNEGEVFGFIGPNGAGKTSTMRVMAGLLQPFAGELSVCGRDAVNEPESVRARIGYMPDFFGVYDQLKVWEYLEFFGELYPGTAPLRPRIDETLDLLGLAVKRDSYVETLSRGMKQRLCLARAILHRPPLLILDEPASGMDPQSRVDIRNIILRLSREGRTVFISSHILSELSGMCTHIGIIEAGRLRGAGKVEEMLRRLRGGRRLAVGLADPERGEELARAAAGVLSVRRIGDRLEVEIEDRDEAAEGLLRALVEGGVRPRSVAEEKPELERLYLELTEGKVT